MKITVKVSLLIFVISVGFTFLFYALGILSKNYEIIVFVNMFLLVVSISTGLYLSRKKDNFVETPLIQDFKSALQSGIIFAVLLGVFTYIYHAKIDTSLIDEKVYERLEWIKSSVPNEEVYLELQKSDPTWQDKTYLDYIENQEDQTYSIISAKTLSIITTLVGFILTFFFSFFIVLIIRKVVLREV